MGDRRFSKTDSCAVSDDYAVATRVARGDGATRRQDGWRIERDPLSASHRTANPPISPDSGGAPPPGGPRAGQRSEPGARPGPGLTVRPAGSVPCEDVSTATGALPGGMPGDDHWGTTLSAERTGPPTRTGTGPTTTPASSAAGSSAPGRTETESTEPTAGTREQVRPQRGGAKAAREPHKLEVAGSNPAPATNASTARPERTVPGGESREQVHTSGPGDQLTTAPGGDPGAATSLDQAREDRAREARIAHYQRELAGARTREARAFAWLKLSAEIARRSPEQVTRMERERGLDR